MILIERLRPYADNVIIYHKWNEVEARFPVKKRIKIDNVWREWHTYLHHIITNYHSLAKNTIFFQGNIEDHKKDWLVYKTIEEYIYEVQKKWFAVSSLGLMKKRTPQITYYGKFQKMLESGNLQKADISFSEFYKKIFSKQQPCIIIIFCWGNFWVSKELIQKRKVEFYKNLYQYLNNHPNPEEGHYLERLWFQIFNHKLFYRWYILKKIAINIYKYFLKRWI